MRKDERKIIITDDGSPTIRVANINEHYHSVYGAKQESEHIYIKNGLSLLNKKKIRLLEIGFGTGLNAFLSCIETDKRDISIMYETIEKYPLEPQEWKALSSYYKPQDHKQDYFGLIHSCDWGRKIKITDRFFLKKIEGDIICLELNDTYDVVYFDAFAPDVQKELWSKEVYKKIFSAMNKGSVLTTFSAKGKVRRDLTCTGFIVVRKPGPPGKKEIITAFKK